MHGKIIVISGPSGVGKTTLYKRLLKEFSDKLAFSVSATTRHPRAGEVEGVDYYFLSPEEFQRMIDHHEFVEWEEVYDHLYGTPKTEITRITKKEGKHCLLDIDVHGGIHIKHSYPESHLVFISPPSIDTLQERIRTRNQDDPQEMESRLKNALHELNYANKYDHIIINQDLEAAYKDLKEWAGQFI